MRRIASAVLVVLAFLVSGCRSVYLTRLAIEQARFIRAATPATDLLATTEDPDRRRALQALVDVRSFAAAEGLEVGGSYRKVSDSQKTSPFYVVTAAYVDRLEPYTWWYPVVGSIPYRGYFDREPAEQYAARLRKDGLDTMIVEASAYSTLGWLDDPLPSSVVDRGEQAVVVTVLHELVHQTFFAPGQVELNETLATAVSWRLAERFYEARGDAAAAASAREWREAWIRRSDALDAAAEKLRLYYAKTRTLRLERGQVLADRERIYAEVLADIERVDESFAAELRAGGLDNASFLAAHRYSTGGRTIDAFLASAPTIDEALDRLADEIDRDGDLDRVLLGAPVPVP